jgi:hypothetical protein
MWQGLVDVEGAEMKARQPNRVTVHKKTFTERQTVAEATKAYSYTAWAITGWLNGKRVRKQASAHGEALKQKTGWRSRPPTARVRSARSTRASRLLRTWKPRPLSLGWGPLTHGSD